MAKSVSSREINIIQRAFRPEGDTDFAMFYTLYHIFKQESIQGRGTIKGRHLALYRIFKTTGTVFTTKYVINIYMYISSQNDPFYTKQSGFLKYHLRFVYFILEIYKS